MIYNFDEIVTRKGSNCVKYDVLGPRFGNENAIPLWVADMDFKTPPFIINAIKKRLEHEILGYTIRPAEYFSSIVNWVQKRHGWNIDPRNVSFSPGVVAGFTLAIERFTRPGDKIIVQPPVYFPFFDSVVHTGRRLVNNPLMEKNGRLNMDFEQLDSIIDSDTKMILISNPHNPGGSVWTKTELEQLAAICKKHNLMVVSDEIHADLVYKPHKHIPFASISDDAAQRTLTLMAPSKTFNTAGLTTSIVIAQNNEILKEYNRSLNVPHLHMGNIFGSIALMAAFTEGEEWLAQLIDYLSDNVKFVVEYFEKYLPKFKVMIPEATFLLWIDCKNTGLNDKDLQQLLVSDANIAVNEGYIFGQGGEGHIRMNIGCPRSILEKALNQLSQVFKQ